MRGTLLYFGLTLCATLACALTWAHWPHRQLDHGIVADSVVVLKSERRLLLYRGDTAIGDYPVSLGFSPVGQKSAEGDGKTPEGRYNIDYHNPQSTHFYSLSISYPNKLQRQESQRLGLNPGGQIMIHGLHRKMWFIGRLHRFRDWTLGCIALTNDELRDLIRAVPPGTPIHIVP
jgi:murein L,D-transpeptidase YafK